VGPKGFTVVKAEMDLRPGGTYHYAMKSRDGNTIWGKFVYREVAPPSKLVFINSFSDENGGITRRPLQATWPTGDAFDVHFRGHGRRQDTLHRALGNA
jgi:uncharacterized protein YndB with AHSA1/START domain